MYSLEMLHPLLQLGRPVGLLSEGAAPTKAYWLGGLDAQQGADAWVELDPHRRPEPRELAALGALVVVRTIPRRWLGTIRALRRSGLVVVLLLDDALLDPAAVAEQEFRYRLRLWLGITRHRRRLASLFNELWVTNPALEISCRSQLGSGSLPIQVLPLQPPARVVQPPQVIRVAYLGTASHGAEYRWLLPLLQQLQEERRDCLVELILPPGWRRHFKQLPRTRILYPMDWETYLLDTGNRSIDVVLVPLLLTRFNACRSPVKFLEVARLGAVGIYSDRAPYNDLVRDGHDGVLVPDQPQAWLSALHQLLNGPERRKAMAAACGHRALGMCVKER